MFPLVLLLPLLGCGCVQASTSLGLVFARLCFSQTSPGLVPAFVKLWLPPVFVLLLVGFSCAQASPSLCLAFAGLRLCIGIP